MTVYQPTPESLSLYDDFLAHTSIDRLQKILARYELFKRIQEVPGDIVECGVYKGSGLYTWAKLTRIFKPNNEQKIIGFDFFEADRTVEFNHAQDQEVLDFHQTGWSPQEVLLNRLAQLHVHNVELVAGNVQKTIPAYAQANLGFRISLLYLDLDNYEGTLAALEHFYPRVVPGGIIAFDEYAQAGYGESDAVDEYFRNKSVKLQSFHWANTPTAYLVKEQFE